VISRSFLLPGNCLKLPSQASTYATLLTGNNIEPIDRTAKGQAREILIDL